MYSSDEEPDHELLELLRQSRGLNLNQQNARPETHVLKSAEFIVDHSIDVALDRQSVVNAADAIYNSMHKRAYSTETWSQHELHPKAHHEDTPAFIFTMDLLNFSFYSELDEEERFRINYGGKAYTGYWSLVALLQRALDEGGCF